jgi:hypothetical protein
MAWPLPLCTCTLQVPRGLHMLVGRPLSLVTHSLDSSVELSLNISLGISVDSPRGTRLTLLLKPA